MWLCIVSILSEGGYGIALRLYKLYDFVFVAQVAEEVEEELLHLHAGSPCLRVHVNDNECASFSDDLQVELSL